MTLLVCTKLFAQLSFEELQIMDSLSYAGPAGKVTAESSTLSLHDIAKPEALNLPEHRQELLFALDSRSQKIRLQLLPPCSPRINNKEDRNFCQENEENHPRTSRVAKLP